MFFIEGIHLLSFDQSRLSDIQILPFLTDSGWTEEVKRKEMMERKRPSPPAIGSTMCRLYRKFGVLSTFPHPGLTQRVNGASD